MKTRGIMIDCSRNGVMNVKTLKRFIDVISDLRYNVLELYMEDTLKVEGEPYLGYMRGGYSIEEIREIDCYALSKGIELIPAVQTLSHYSNTAKLRKYMYLFDVNDTLLIDNEETYELIDKIFATIAKAFSSKRVNIGMDEAHMVGLGRYFEQHGLTDRHELLARHLKRVAKIGEKYGFEMHMWSDMFFKLSNQGNYYSRTPVLSETAKKALPHNVSPVYWDYYHTDKADYDAMFEVHKQFDSDTWFAGGIWSWTGFAPHNDFSIESMKPAIMSANEHGIQNAMFTMWGDNGKECSYFALLPAIYSISRYLDGEYDDNKIKREFYKKYGITYDAFCTLDLPNHYYKDGKRQEFTAKIPFYSDLFVGMSDDIIAEVENIDYAGYARKITSARKKAGNYAYIFDSLAELCKVLDIKWRLGVRIRSAYKQKNIEELKRAITDINKLSIAIKKYYTAYKNLWYTENKSNGFEIQDIRFGGLLMRIDSCKERLQNYIDNGIEIEELDEDLLPNDGCMYFADYSSLISPSNI